MKSKQTDEHLIEQFLTGPREEAESAFEQLVARHGPLVMGACRQVLKCGQDAEDAFQATFLALARQAATIQNRQSLDGWLRAVARRTAFRLRAQHARHRWRLELDCENPLSEEAESHAMREEMRLIVRNELDRLPENYRALVVHCYLEGKSNQEVAQLMGFPVGTVKGRLWRARGMLRQRLESRGRREADCHSRAPGTNALRFTSNPRRGSSDIPF